MQCKLRLGPALLLSFQVVRSSLCVRLQGNNTLHTNFSASTLNPCSGCKQKQEQPVHLKLNDQTTKVLYMTTIAQDMKLKQKARLYISQNSPTQRPPDLVFLSTLFPDSDATHPHFQKKSVRNVLCLTFPCRAELRLHDYIYSLLLDTLSDLDLKPAMVTHPSSQ